MSTYTSTTRITGLSSGLDIDSMVEQLMKAESTKYNTLQRKQQTVTWQQEAYRDIISKLQTFQEKWFGTAASSTNFRYSKAFANFQNTVMNADGTISGAITVNSATSDSEYDITVTQIAKADSYVGQPSSMNKELISSKSIDEIASSITENTSLEFNVDLDGVTKTIEITADDLAGAADDEKGQKVLDLINDKLKAYGTTTVNGSTINKITAENNGGKLEFKVNVDNGDGHTLTISEGSTRTSQSVKTSNIDVSALTEGLGEDETRDVTVNVNGKDITVSLAKGDDNDALVTKLNEAIKEQAKTDSSLSGLSVSLATEETEEEKDDDGNVIKESETTYQLSFTNTSSTKDVTVSGITGLGDDVTVDETTLTHTGSVSDLGFTSGATSSVNTSDNIEGLLSGIQWDSDGNYSFKINDKEVTISKTDTLSGVMNKISNGTGVKMTYNSVTKAFKLQAEETGAANAITADDAGKALMSQFGIDIGGTGSDHKVVAQDAILSIDGVTTTRSTNDVNIDGLSITLNSATGAGGVKVNSAYDTDAMVEKIKTFVEEYNTLISDLNTQVTTTRSKSDDYTYYEPLLDEEKEAMTESEIEKWETEAKKGVLYNDTVIKSLLTNLRSALYNTVTTEDGTLMSIYSIGITTTSDYTKGGQLVIDEDKLRESISKNGDKIQEMFVQSTTGLADTMKNLFDGVVGTNGTLRTKAGIVGTSSVSENTLSKQLSTINEQISAERERLESKEEYYYQLFSNMESAINQSNTQLDYLMSMLSY